MDTFFLFGGTNDSWFDVPLGTEKDAEWEEKTFLCIAGVFLSCGFAQKHLPDTRFYCIVNTGIKDEIADSYSRTCAKYGVDVIRLADIEKQGGHPTVTGMKAIYQQVLDCISKKSS